MTLVKRINNNIGLVKDQQVLFVETAMIHVKDDVFNVPANNIFYKNNKLLSGIVCRKLVVDQKIGNFITGTQEFFQVVDSHETAIHTGDKVIAVARTATEFSYLDYQLYFIPTENILVVIHGSDINAGPCYVMLKSDHFGYDDANISTITSAEGVYFKHYSLRFFMKDKLHLVVSKANIVAISECSPYANLIDA